MVPLVMDLGHLRYFYEVASAGSFTAASRKLRVSQSALSKAVALLELREGQKLLQRSKKGVSLTKVGIEVFQMSRDLFSKALEIQSVLKGKRNDLRGPLLLGSSDHIASYYLPSVVSKIKHHHPGLTPSIFSGTPHDIVSLILSQEIEFGLFFSKTSSPTLTFQQLATMEMALVCSPVLIKSEIRDLGISQLRKLVDQVGLIGSIKSQYQKHPSQSLFERLGSEVRVSFESNSQEVQKRACMAGVGIAYLARFMVRSEIESGQLVEIPVRGSLELSLWLAQKKGQALSGGAKVFIDLLRTSF